MILICQIYHNYCPSSKNGNEVGGLLWFPEGHQLTVTHLVNWEVPLLTASDPSALRSNWGARPPLIGTSLLFCQRPSVPTSSRQLRHPFLSAHADGQGHWYRLRPGVRAFLPHSGRTCTGSHDSLHLGNDTFLISRFYFSLQVSSSTFCRWQTERKSNLPKVT